MILKKVYKTNNAIKSTLLDGVDKVDEGVLDNGTHFVNVYFSNRKKEDEFETIIVDGVDVFIENESGKTLQIIRSSR